MRFDDEGKERQADMLQQAIAFAGKYARTFDPELLDNWYKLVVEKSLPDNSTMQEFAAHNAVRHFVVGIIRQYQLAQTGSADTPWPKNRPQLPRPPKRRPRKA